MIITRTPYRVSFFGGGTDFPAHYLEHGGAVLSTSINRYSHIQCRVLPPFFDHRYCVRYSRTERVSSIDEINHPSVRECLRFLDYSSPLEVLHSGDIPAMSGIGSSSAFTVGFLLAVSGIMGKMRTKRELALDAIEVEQNWIREYVGSQDQFASAFGGFNRIDFQPDGQIQVTPWLMRPECLSYLQDSLLFCFSGISRISSEIQEEHVRRLKDITAELSEMRALVDEAGRLLNGDRESINEFGALLDAAWRIKKKFSSRVSNGTLDELYATGINAGALGGKVCGSGGGGFLVFFVPPERRKAVIAALKGVLVVPIRIEHLGAHVLFYSHEALESGTQGSCAV